MARPKSPVLTEVEQQLMEIVWAKRQASVADVVEALPKSRPLAFNTVQTTLRILEDKGFLKHTTAGRAFVYEAAVARDEASRTALRHLLGRFFDDSAELLAQSLLQNQRLTEAELSRIEALVAEARKRA
ncbi:MAG TPA: BlaI/MecI/CopY family transcriptional regulator [Candidatus Eremiobacteraceae bacterium]|nr:BlaI/MecI/CopY family transcriptional regulator [Candidatus Eremiobacteraceae bacterium]